MTDIENKKPRGYIIVLILSVLYMVGVALGFFDDFLSAMFEPEDAAAFQAMGEAMGAALIKSIIGILLIVFTACRKYEALLITEILAILFSSLSPILFLIAIIILIITMADKKCKKYLKKL